MNDPTLLIGRDGLRSSRKAESRYGLYTVSNHSTQSPSNTPAFRRIQNKSQNNSPVALAMEYSTFTSDIQTPFGAMRLVTLPMGWTNSVPIFHDDVTYILQPEIPHTTIPYIDDVPV